MSATVRPLARLSIGTARWTPQWTCAGCRVQARAPRRTTPVWQREFSSTIRRRDDKTEERLRRIQEENAARIKKQEEEARQLALQKAKRLRDEEAAAEARRVEAENQRQRQNETTNTTIRTTPAALPATAAETSKALPSHAESKRSDLQKRALKLLDDLLVKANTISQQVNQYTGTDYTGIEALRQEIAQQEQQVRQRSKDLTAARDTLNEAYASQATAQREIVGLLERKSSWSPSDLERYMSLVRSEHLNEQNVTHAKEGLEKAEQRLEEVSSSRPMTPSPRFPIVSPSLSLLRRQAQRQAC